MSMGAILKQVRDHLRDAMPLAADQCDIRPDGEPPQSAGELFVAVDELGVTSTARSYIEEQFEVEVAVWRRAGQYPADRIGDAQLSDDPYTAGLFTLDDLEREAIRRLHGNFTDVTAAVNTALGTGSGNAGDSFRLALYYEGRGRTEVLPPSRGAQQPAQWLGRRLRFVGMNRIQALDVIA